MTPKQIKQFKSEIEKIRQAFGLDEFTIVVTEKVGDKVNVYHDFKYKKGSKSVIERLATINTETLMYWNNKQKTNKP